ncbi:hypothetical protein F5Y17DRAFT_472915 [Xylariaceae sp. FL0594]|nr:hypothetical protein F5Y17DRAFT_472915 [Xylariaceae sp. FL0594]
MAIIPGIPGLEVTVEVAGIPVPEYEIPPDALKSAKLDQPQEYLCLRSRYPGPRSRSLSRVRYSVKFIEVKAGDYPSIEIFKSSDYQRKSHHIAYRVEFDDLKLKIRHEPYVIKEEWVNSSEAELVRDGDGLKSAKFRFAHLKYATKTMQ